MAHLSNSADADRRSAEEIAAEVETGGRHPKDVTGWLIVLLALCWSFFQLYIAYTPINSIIARSIHLAFAITMVFLSFPGRKKPETPRWMNWAVQIFPGFVRPRRSPREAIPWYDYVLAVLAGCGALYMAWDYEGIIQR
ncbi:MAG: TRAP transporter permease, partial [Nitrospinota bacterium]